MVMHDHTVPYGTVLQVNAFPGTSCQATIAPSLRDKSRSPIEGPRISYSPLLVRYQIKTFFLPDFWEIF
jgi:hypothetical protein